MTSKSRKVFRVVTQNVDVVTGEILSQRQTTTYASRSSESFGMYRSTDGLEWALELKSQMLFLMVMNEYSNHKTGITTLSKLLRGEISEFFGFTSNRSLTNLISQSIDRNGLTRINGSMNDFMVNPMCFFKGSTKDLKDRINKYNEYRGL